MSKKKVYFITFLSIALLCVAGFLWAYFVTSDIRKNVQGALNQAQQVQVKNLILTETKDAKKYWELYAKGGSYDSRTKLVILTDIIGNFYNEKQEVVLSFESPKGTYEDGTKLITLEGESLFVSKDGSSILADKITWQGKNTDIVATGNVRIKRNDELTTLSEKAVFAPDFTSFKIIGKSQVQIFSDKAQTEENFINIKGN